MQAHTVSAAAVQATLSRRREELAQRLAALQADLARASEPLSPDFSEQAGQRENDEVLQALHDGTESELRELDAALQRLRSGEYGVCAQCGYPIEPRRLEAVPYTDCCSLCASQRP
jgi:RNA polymerase-binding transcription factor DksA